VFRAYPEHLYFLVKARVGIIAALALGLWLATQHLGLVGAAAAVVGVAMLERLIVAWKAGVILGVTRRDLGLLTSIGKVALAAIAAGVAAALVRQLIAGAHPVQVLTVCGAVSTFVYLASLLALRVLTPEELGHLRRQRSAFPWNVLWRRTPS
jgi:hypothetical protein